MKRILKPLIVALAIALPMTAAAQVYSWTDASGTVHYSQSPPGNGIKYHIVPVRGMDHAQGPSNAPADTESDTSAPKASPSGNSAADTAPSRKRFCGQLQDNIKLLQSDQMVSYTDAKGVRTPMPPERRAEELKRAQAQYQDYCGEQ